jgi:hypothetical protein
MTTATYSPTSAVGSQFGGQIGSTVGSVPFGMQHPYATNPSYGLADPTSAAQISALIGQLGSQFNGPPNTQFSNSWNPGQSIMGVQSPQIQAQQLQAQQLQAQQIQAAAHVQALQQTLQSLHAQLQQALIQQSYLHHAARQSQHPLSSVVGSY